MNRAWIRCLGGLLVLLGLAACQTLPNSPEAEEIEMPGDRPGDIYVALGEAYMREGRYKVALRKLLRGLRVDPDNPKIHRGLALLYQTLGENAKAEAEFAEAVRLAPRDPYTRNARGNFFYQQGQYDKADAEFRKALEDPLYATPWVALTNAGICAQQAGRPERAEAYLRRALEKNPGFPLALWGMARVSFAQGRYLDARHYLARLRQVSAPTPETLWLEIQTAHHLGDLRTLYQTRLELERRYPDAPEVQMARELTRKR